MFLVYLYLLLIFFFFCSLLPLICLPVLFSLSCLLSSLLSFFLFFSLLSFLSLPLLFISSVSSYPVSLFAFLFDFFFHPLPLLYLSLSFSYFFSASSFPMFLRDYHFLLSFLLSLFFNPSPSPYLFHLFLLSLFLSTVSLCPFPSPHSLPTITSSPQDVPQTSSLPQVFFEKIFVMRPWKALFVTTDDDIHEWWFRWQLDRYR